MRENNLQRLNSNNISIDHVWYLHYNSYHNDLLKAFEKYAKGNLLDIGCGNKPYYDVLSPSISSYIGCDIIQSNKNCVDVICPANDLPLESNCFDTVISTQTIEHVEDHQGLINEAYRTLKKGGYFVLSGPLYWPLHEEPYDFFRFTKYGFSYILEKAGFKIISIESNGGKWAVAGQALLHAIYPHIFHVKGLRGKVLRGLLKIFGGIKTINKIFLYLDRKDLDYKNTLNYVIVAEK